MDGEPDSELLKKAQSGDAAAFESLVERHQARVFALAFRMLGSKEDAAEVVQDVFLSAFRHLREFRGDAAFGSWVHRIAANEALMRLRHRKIADTIEDHTGEPTFNERGSLLDMVADWGRTAEGQTLDAELRHAIDQAAAKLSPELREVFVLRDLEGLSYDEVAELAKITVPAVKSRLHRARLALRAAIDAFYAEHGG